LATALANKLARIAWTILAQRRNYETHVAFIYNMAEYAERLSFPKNPSVRIRVMGQNQRIIRCDACDPSSAWDGYHQPV
jgi:hypothetical protein